MDYHRNRSGWLREALLRRTTGLALVGAVLGPAIVKAQQPATMPPLVFDSVTVVDVERGRLIQGQRVVIVGNRIRTMGNVQAVRVPTGARVVDARGKYLIPGLWDMHVHPRRYTEIHYPLFIASGVTGIRDAGSEVPLDTLLLWRREILAGARVGPPRQLLSGQALLGPQPGCERHSSDGFETCVADSADAVHVVDSLKAAGADMIKPRLVGRKLYFAIAAEARRVGIPFGGHIERVTALEASDSGASIVDHMSYNIMTGRLGLLCYLGNKEPDTDDAGPDPDNQFQFTPWKPVGGKGTVEQCRQLEERFRHNGTWFTTTLGTGFSYSEQIWARASERAQAFWAGALLRGNWLRDSASARISQAAHPDSSGATHFLQGMGLPILAGTDVSAEAIKRELPGFSLHTELAMLVAEGVTPLAALQSATLNPAKLLHGIDSLGTVAPGKLADLVLLDADPLQDITNTTTVRAVVANGRYYDRATLDQLLADVQAKAKRGLIQVSN